MKSEKKDTEIKRFKNLGTSVVDTVKPTSILEKKERGSVTRAATSTLILLYNYYI